MSSEDDLEGRKAPPVPSFSGNEMPAEVSVGAYDYVGLETTRRADNAIFRSVQAFTSAAQLSSIDTTQQKVRVDVAPPLPMTPQAGWNLESAPVLPEFHPLDRNSIFCPDTLASEVAERLAQVLKERSIEAHFDNSKAKIRCLTVYNVDFRVFLYRGQGKYAHGIVVEVQRRTGASSLFVKDTQAILEAAQGKIPPPSPPLFSTAEIPLVSDAEDDSDDDYSASLSSLDFCSKMFSYQNYGSDMLALQTLSSLTDPAKMGVSTSKKISRALVEPNNEVGATVFAFIVDSHKDQDHSLRNLALPILANVLQGVNGNVNHMMRESLRPVLIRELKHAKDNPQMAYFAARCLEPLIAGDHYAFDLYPVLDTALSVGEARHVALRDICKKCIRRLDSR